MLIASKFEEIYPPECSDFVYVSDGAYTKKTDFGHGEVNVKYFGL